MTVSAASHGRTIRLAIALLVASLNSACAAKPEPPAIPLAGRVTDAAQVIDPVREAALVRKLAAFEGATKHQLVVVTVPSLKGEEIGKYTLRLANAWGIGRAAADDGVVLLVAPAERKIRIEVGRGLAAELTDARCSQIIKTDMLPRFRANDLPGGIEIIAAL